MLGLVRDAHHAKEKMVLAFSRHCTGAFQPHGFSDLTTPSRARARARA